MMSSSVLRSLYFLTAALLLFSLAAQGQVEDPEPDRPELPTEADTNDAAAYYTLGLEKLAEKPKDAAKAFYWAARLAPNWADPLYARRVALLISKPKRLHKYFEDDEKTLGSREIQRIDSLELRALQRDPFVYRDLDNELITVYLTEVGVRQLSRKLGPRYYVNRRELKQFVEDMLRDSRWAMWRAWRAYSERRFHDALAHYLWALLGSADSAHIYTQRGRIFYLLGQYDSAQVQLTHALTQRRRQDEDKLVFQYDSKAMLEYSIGLTREALGDLPGAREAYGNALLEDLAFYPAHVRLGVLALGAGDTTTALSEFRLAAELNPNVAVPHIVYGKALLIARRLREAMAQLERARALEPYYCEIYALLGTAAYTVGDIEQAAAHYAAFLERAPQSDERRGAVIERLAALEQP